MKEHISLWWMPVKHSSPAAPLMETQVRIIIRMPDWWGWLLSYLKYSKLSGSDCSLFVYFLEYNVNRRGLITHPALGHSGIQEWSTPFLHTYFSYIPEQGLVNPVLEGRILARFYILQVDNAVSWDCSSLGKSSSCLVGLQSGPRKTEFAHPCSRRRTLKHVMRMSPHVSVQSNVTKYNGINLNSRLVCKYYSCLLLFS